MWRPSHLGTLGMEPLMVRDAEYVKGILMIFVKKHSTFSCDGFIL